MVHAYNLSYLGDRDQEDCSLRPSQVESQCKPISTSNVGVVHVPVIPATWEALEEDCHPRLVPAKKHETLSEK
jgi:hypothetical protein